MGVCQKELNCNGNVSLGLVTSWAGPAGVVMPMGVGVAFDEMRCWNEIYCGVLPSVFVVTFGSVSYPSGRPTGCVGVTIRD